MRWTRSANRMLVEAIADSFRDTGHSRRLFAEFRPKDWAQTEFWLDASGLALYFLDHVQSIGIEDVIDPTVIKTLEQKVADNRERRNDMFEEFLGLNAMFQEANICYANLKGFTLSPDSCHNPDLRFQIDFDFLIDPAQRNLCLSLLETRGYQCTAATRSTWEFKVGNPQGVSMKNHYKASTHRSLELHFTLDAIDTIELSRDPRLDRLGLWSGLPALSAADQMIGQALHVLSHLRGSATRPSWLLEFRRHVTIRRNDKEFWRELHTLARPQPHAITALGLSVLLATDLFGSFSPPELNTWTLDQLPPRVRLWGEHYGRRVLFADVPGTKLYLLLEKELSPEQHPLRKTIRQRLIPLEPPPRVMRPQRNDSLRTRIYQEIIQFRFILFRLRFHLTEGLRYAIELGRWKQLIKEDLQRQSGPQAPLNPLRSFSETKTLSPCWPHRDLPSHAISRSVNEEFKRARPRRIVP